MARNDRSNPLGRVIGACFSLLCAAIAIYVAIHLLIAVWPEIAVGVAVVGMVVMIASIFRARNRGW